MCLNPKFGKFPCGKCVECKEQYSTEWAFRCMLEASKHEQNCFITLTYNDANLPKEGVCKRSAQLFMKRLRKSIEPLKVRYFLCGEYGAEKNRPHYHIILFGYDFQDKWLWCYDSHGLPLYRSPRLEKLWQFGYSTIGAVDFESAKYCAKYMQADGREYVALGLNRPFTLSSRRPGIALDVIPDTVFQYGDVYIDGFRRLAPRAFLKKFKELFPERYENLMFHKLRKSEQYIKLLWEDDVIIEDYKKFYEEYYSYLEQDKYNIEEARKSRQKKYKKIFGKSIDNEFRPVLSLKRKKYYK